jgi:hypothetical protein
MEAVRERKQDTPLPIYFNLANTGDQQSLSDILLEMDRVLSTNIKPNLQTAVHLFIDSYDEGVRGDRINLVQRFLSDPCLPQDLPHKVIITCRQDTLKDSEHQFFQPEQGKLLTSYIAPLNYI